MAAARMLLLATTVVLFAAAWSGDRPRDRRDLAAIRPKELARLTASSRGPLAGRLRSDSVPAPAIDADLLREWMTALPFGVTAGDYWLVEDSGRTQRVCLTMELLQSLGHDPDVSPQPMYVLNRGRRTAYLIRIVPAADVLQIAAEPQTIR